MQPREQQAVTTLVILGTVIWFVLSLKGFTKKPEPLPGETQRHYKQVLDSPN